MEKNLNKKPVFQNLIKTISPFFIKNEGQIDSKIKYYTSNKGFSCYLTSQEVMFSFVKRKSILTSENTFSKIEGLKYHTLNHETKEKYKGVALYLKFFNANENAEILPQYECNSKINYFKGDDQNNWYKNLPTYEKIVYKNLWSNIDLTFYSTKGELKYEFILYSGACLNDINLSYVGGDIIKIDKSGNMIITTNIGNVVDKKPISYQIIKDKKVTIDSSFVLKNENIFSFEIDESYDKNYPLIIDPGLEYSTYLGGNNEDVGWGIDVDNQGNAYVVGKTLSTNFPTAPGVNRPNGLSDAFIAKVNTLASGTASLVYFTYIGGSSDEEGRGIAIDSNKFVYITGRTTSRNFPTTPLTAYQPTMPLPLGNSKAFVTKFSADGSSLLYSSYLGGNNFDSGVAIAVDNNENAYITGSTLSSKFPTTPAAYQATDPNPTDFDGFISKINTKASGAASLAYSTYLGGHNADYPFDIAVDNNSNAYIAGNTLSTDFPTTPTAYQTTDPNGASTSAFICKINTLAANNASLAYSTYLGGDSSDTGQGIAIDNYGNAYITGSTTSRNFPKTPTAFQPNRLGNTDAYITKINALASGDASLMYSTYLGGSNTDVGQGIAVDNYGNAYVTGYTLSNNFPTTKLSAYQPTGPSARNVDAFVTKINTLASGDSCLMYSTYLGGNNTDFGQRISIDNYGNAYVTGNTLSTNFPTTPTAYQVEDPSTSSKDAFVTKIATMLRINCPNDITVPNVPNTSGARVTFTVTTSGGCGEPIITCNPGSGSLFPIGTTKVNCTATDSCGNIATCTFNITVVNDEPVRGILIDDVF